MRKAQTKARLKKISKSTVTRETIEPGSGNVYADLGFPDAEERLLKAELAVKIAELIDQKGLTQIETARRVGLDQPKISCLLRGKLSGFSADRLFAILNRLGHSIEVRISAKERSPEKTHTYVKIA